jgi:murein DD-endopeptidase MepM/ murein hydrolase activator NlpD
MTSFKMAATLTVLCAALGACADLTPRPQYPVRTPVAPAPVAPAPAPPAPAPSPPPAAPSEDDPPKAAPSTPVDQSTLPPPPGAKVAPPRRSSANDADDVMVGSAAADDSSVTVGKGDTLAKIAKKAGVSTEDLAKANKIEAPYRLRIGQTLSLPGSTSEPALPKGKAAKSSASKAAEQPKTVTVDKGDTLAKIAKKTGVSMEDLAEANGLAAPYRLTAGEVLALSPAAPEPAPPKSKPGKSEPVEAKTVTVGKGDTLAKIAKTAGVSIDDLAKANNLAAPYRLKAGQTLTVPAAAPPREPAPKAEAPKASKTAAPTSVKVGKGQTLQTIADKAGVLVADLAKLNHIKKPYRVRRGQTIQLPVQDEAAAESELPPAQSHAKAPAAKAAPPRVVTAGRHDTLQTIADRAGVPVVELAKLNHLKKPYRIKRGQKIKLPGSAAEAPEVSAASSAYKVKKGDTLYSIARQFHTDAKTLADANGLSTGARLTVGRRLQIPGGPLDKPVPTRRPVPVTPEASSPSSAAEPTAPVPYSSLPTNPPTSSAPGLAPPPVTSTPYRAPQPYTRPAPAPEASAPAPTLSDTDIAAAGKGLFQWPIRGRILSMYGTKPGAQRNDGLDIAGAMGDPVRAAAGGEVVYAGNSVPGFGNLVLIRHDGGWVTVYAHLANIDVKMRQIVAQGQQIGEVGQTGGVDQTQLHFEVRYAPNVKDKAKLVDPLLVLPQ